MPLIAAVFWVSWALIVYTYAIYPLVLASMARLFGNRPTTPPDPRDEELPRVAMIVAAFNEAGVLNDKLINTWQIDYPADRFRVLIGSDGSSDATADILASCRDPRLRAFPFTERRGKISVLNDLVQEADAEILVMSDANTTFSPGSVRSLVRGFGDPRVGCVSGELTLEQGGGVSGEGLYWKYEGWVKRTESRLGFLIGCNGGIYALRKELYHALPASTVVDDFVITMRVLEQRFEVRFDPGARAVEPPCPTARAEMIRKIRIGAGGFQALALAGRLLRPEYGVVAFGFWSHKVLRWMVPFFWLVALIANLALIDHDLYVALLALQASGAMVAGCAYNVRAGGRMPRWTRPISYFYLMNYALLCGFLRFLLRTQRVTWDRASR